MEIKIQKKIKIKSVRIPSNESDLWFRVPNSAQVAVPGEGGGRGEGGRVGKIKMGDYRMKWRGLSVKQEAVMMFQYSGEVDQRRHFPWPDNDLSRLFGAAFYDVDNARTTPWFFTLTGSKSNVKYEINIRDEVSPGDVKAVPHSVDFSGPLKLRHGKPVSVMTEVERNLCNKRKKLKYIS